jgi:hypothetical protein
MSNLVYHYSNKVKINFYKLPNIQLQVGNLEIVFMYINMQSLLYLTNCHIGVKEWAVHETLENKLRRDHQQLDELARSRHGSFALRCSVWAIMW